MEISEYKKRIWQYEKRREASYATSRRLSAKIRQMKQCLASREARIEKANIKIDSLINAVNDFFSVDIKSSSRESVHQLARKVYYKIGLEMQLREVILCRRINRRSQIASYHREVFTASFKTNEENKKVFHNFKEYIKIIFEL
jgi:hypothetical protein